MVLVFGWPRGVGMVRKWKWYPLTERGSMPDIPTFAAVPHTCVHCLPLPADRRDGSS